MSTMERRLQLLLDQERYARVATEADRSGRSVAAVIREAIDLRFPDDDDERRMRAARRLLDRTAEPDGGGFESAADLKDIYTRHLEEKLARS
ncbi:MAG: hypothetical protein ACRCZD_22485 [Phycicoccus sp.]